MITLKELKENIEKECVGREGIIFLSQVTFVPKQYIKEISRIYQKEIQYVDNIDMLKQQKMLFGNVVQDNILVFITDKIDKKITLKDFCYIICTKECKDNEYIQVPKLEPWHLIDYVRTNSSSLIDESDIEKLVSACNNDIYLIDNEMSKYTLFEEQSQKSIFAALSKANQLKRSYDGDIFQFTTALLNKDISGVSKFLVDLDNYDIEPLGVLTIVYRQLRNMISVGFNPNPTEQNTGLSSKQIYWIRKNLAKHTSKEILNSFQIVCEAEKYMKEGTISNKQLLDYIVVNLL